MSTNDRIEYRRSLGLPNLALDEKRPCPRCGAERDRDTPDGCRDFDCPTAQEIDALEVKP